MRGKLIAIDGIDGSGKSSLIRELIKNSNGKLLAYETFEHRPMITEFLSVANECNRNIYELFSERTINIAWMMDLFSNTYNKIEKLLDEGFNVVLDRYILSAKVYSIATTNSNISDLFAIYELLPKPDICLYIMVDTECALKRIDDRGEEKVYYENEEYLNQISKAYKDYISKEKYMIEVLDGNLSIEEVTEITLAILKYNGINLIE